MSDRIGMVRLVCLAVINGLPWCHADESGTAYTTSSRVQPRCEAYHLTSCKPSDPSKTRLLNLEKLLHNFSCKKRIFKGLLNKKFLLEEGDLFN